jgi:hypothetical protein
LTSDSFSGKIGAYQKCTGCTDGIPIMDIKMPLTITRRAIAPAWKCNLQTVSRRLKSLPVKNVPGAGKGRPSHVYQLADVLAKVRKSVHVGPLIRSAQDDLSLHVGNGPDVMASAERLEAWLTEPMRHRYAAVRNAMTTGIASARGGAAFLPHLETLLRKVLLHSEVLKHVVMGTPNTISFQHFAPAFALVNSTYEPDAELQVAA